MHATVRRYDGVNESRRDELTKKVNEALIPKLSKLPGFSGYYLVGAGPGVMTSISLFDSQDHADESTRLAATWIKDEQLEGALPNPPKITFGEVIAQKTNGFAAV
jgi:homoserine kinase